MSPTTDPRPYSNILLDRRQRLQLAYRGPIAPNQPIPEDRSIPEMSAHAEQTAMLHVPFVALNKGDNVLIPTLIGRKFIFEMFIYNAGAAQTIQLFQGSSIIGTLLLQLANFPAGAQMLLPLSGNPLQSHFNIESGQSLVLTLAAANAEVDGFLRYRNETNPSA